MSDDAYFVDATFSNRTAPNANLTGIPCSGNWVAVFGGVKDKHGFEKDEISYSIAVWIIRGYGGVEGLLSVLESKRLMTVDEVLAMLPIGSKFIGYYRHR